MIFSLAHITIKNIDLCPLLLLHGINKSVYLHTRITYLVVCHLFMSREAFPGEIRTNVCLLQDSDDSPGNDFSQV